MFLFLPMNIIEVSKAYLLPDVHHEDVFLLPLALQQVERDCTKFVQVRRVPLVHYHTAPNSYYSQLSFQVLNVIETQLGLLPRLVCDKYDFDTP